MSGHDHTDALSGYDYADVDGSLMRIRPARDYPAAAYLQPPAGAGVFVPAHRLAEFTRALYAAAGHAALVPDLPVIHDPDTVAALARDLLYAIEGTSRAGALGTQRYAASARTLLSLGWEKRP